MLLYECGLESMSAVLKLAGAATQLLHPPCHHQSIYGGHTCLLVRVWMRVWAWQLRSPLHLTCTGWAEARDRFAEISRWHFWGLQWAKCLTYYSDKTTFYCGPDHTIKQRWVIPGNRPAESWITPALILQPGRGRIATCAERGKTGSRGPLSFPWWNLEWLHMFSKCMKPVCQKHTLANCLNSAKPSFKSLKCTAGRQKQPVDVCVCALWEAYCVSHQYSSLEDHSQKLCVCVKLGNLISHSIRIHVCTSWIYSWLVIN